MLLRTFYILFRGAQVFRKFYAIFSHRPHSSRIFTQNGKIAMGERRSWQKYARLRESNIVARESFSLDPDIRFRQCFFIDYFSHVHHVCWWYFALVEKRAASIPNFPICTGTFGPPFNSLHRVHRRIFFRRSGLSSTAKFTNGRTRRHDNIFFSEVVYNNVVQVSIIHSTNL